MILSDTFNYLLSIAFDETVECYLKLSFRLFYQIIFFPKLTDGTFNLVLSKIFYDDKYIFELIDQIQSKHIAKSLQMKIMFLEFIYRFFESSKTDRFNDNFIRRLLSTITNMIISEQDLQQHFVMRFVEFILGCVECKFSLGYWQFYHQPASLVGHSQVAQVLLNSANTSNNCNPIQLTPPLWISATETLLGVSLYLFEKKCYKKEVFALLEKYFQLPREEVLGKLPSAAPRHRNVSRPPQSLPATAISPSHRNVSQPAQCLSDSAISPSHRNVSLTAQTPGPFCTQLA